MKMMLGGFACVAMGVRAHAHAVARPRTHARTHARAHTYKVGLHVLLMALCFMT